MIAPKIQPIVPAVGIQTGRRNRQPRQRGRDVPVLVALTAPVELRCNIRAGFARTFHHWRLQAHISLKQVAADLGVTLTTVHLWESGHRFPTGSHFERLMDYTGLTPCRLFCVRADKCVPPACPCRMPKRPQPAGTPAPVIT